jgi:hypothetical protein
MQYAEVPGADIQQIIWGRLMPALEGAPTDHAILGMLAFAVLLMKPDVDLDSLKNAVQSATETIVLTITPVDQEKAN